MRRNLILFFAILVLSMFGTASAQYSGTKTIGVDAGFETVAAAITSINTSGIGAGGLIINVPADYTETFASPTAGRITATGTVSDPVVFQKSGVGANPLITAGIGTTTNLDGIIVLQGSDYITFDGISLQESAGNTTTTTQMEFGYALLKKNATAPFDGCQFVTIKNCAVTLNKAHTATIAVWAGNHIATATTSLVITATTDANSDITVDNITIANSYSGVLTNGYAAATPYTLYDQNITVKNCNITNFGGVSGTAYGIRSIYSNNFVVVSNTIDNASGGVAHIGTIYGIMSSTGNNSSFTARLNNIAINRASSTSSLYGISNAYTGNVTINSNTLQNFIVAGGVSAAVYFINQGALVTASYSANIDSNTIGNSTSLNTTGSIYAISTSNSSPTYNCRYNTINNITRLTAASGSFYGHYNNGSPTTGLITVSNNTISNISQGGTTIFYGIHNTSAAASVWVIRNNNINSITSGSGITYGIYSTYGNNTIDNNTITGFTTTGTIYGIENGSTVTPSAVYQNTVKTLTTSGASSVIYGIRPYVSSSSGVGEYYKNNVYDLSASGATGLVYGISTGGGTTLRVYNNFVSDLRAASSSSTNAVVGLYFAAGTTVQSFYNTVYLNGTSSSATFGSSALYGGSTTTIDLRNNILVNASVPGNTSGPAKTVVFRRSGVTTQGTYYAAGSNNNCLYAGTPDTARVLYFDGTYPEAIQTMAAYKAIVAPKDANSFTENAPFINVASAPYNLHVNTLSPTQTESGGVTVSSPVAITTDYDDETRNASTPDVGADEFVGTGLDLSAPSIAYTAFSNTSSTSAKTLTATITDPSTVPTSGAGLPVLYWAVNSGSYAAVTGSSIGSNQYQFTFGAGVVTTDTVKYYVVAQDGAGTPNVGASPSTGASGFTANPPAVSTPPTTPNSYVIVGAISGTKTIGVSGSDYPSITAAIADVAGKEVVGALTLELLDATYDTDTYPLTIPAFSGVSGTNTVTIKPAAGVDVTLNANVATAAIKLNGADYVMIDGSNNGTTSRNLTIKNHNTAGAAVWVASLGAGAGATYNTIKNCNLIGGSATGSGYGIVTGATAALSTAGEDNDYLTIQNNIITKASNGIYLNGTSGGTNNNITITQNEIGSITDSMTVQLNGIYAVQSTGVTITQNTIQNLRYGTGTNYGMNLGTGFVSATISGNKIAGVRYTGTGGYGGRGLYINTGNASSAISVTNNLIYGMGGDGYTSFANSSMVGIYLEGTTGGIDLYFNTVYLNGNATRAAATLTTAMLLGSSTVTALNMKNNIFANTLVNSTGTAGSKNYSIYSSAANTAFTTSDYNDYFVEGAQGVLGFIASADVTTLGAWQTATGKDVSSVAGDPKFVGLTDPHINTAQVSPVSNAGTSISGITTDYDGDVRSGSPDIGADEYTYAAPSVNDPVAFAATVVSGSQINLTFTPNGNTNNVVVVWNSTGTFTTPSGNPPAVGNEFAGGTLLYNGTVSPQNHTGLTSNTTYYYKAFSFDDASYSPGLTATGTTVTAVPYTENFNAALTLPTGWSGTMGVSATHGASSSNGLTYNLYSSAVTANVKTVRFGGIASGMALEFDYRIVNYSGYPATATTLGTSDSVSVMVSTDNVNFTTIHKISSANHSASTSFATKQIDLSSYVDSLIYVKFLLTWGTGDYYVDIDNFYIGTAHLGAPSAFSATPISTTAIDLNFTPDAQSHNVVIVYNSTGTFTTPSGTPPSAGGSLAGGTLIYNGITSPFHHTGLTPATSYYYKAFSVSDTNYSSGLALTASTMCPIAITPYNQSFDSTLFPPQCWTLTNAGSGNSWTRATSGTQAGAGVMKYNYNSTYAADAWAFTPEFTLTSGITYRVSFYQKVESGYPEKMKVTVGSAATPASQTTVLWDNAGGASLSNTTYAYRTADYNCTTTGAYYFAFNCYSDADQWAIYVDEIQVKEIPAIDLSLSSFVQFNGTKKVHASDYIVTMGKSRDGHAENYFTGFPENGSVAYADNTNNTVLLKGSEEPSMAKTLNNITLKGVIENLGKDAAAYDFGWTVGGVAQTTYVGPSVATAGRDTAVLTYTPSARGTFYTPATITVTGDEVTSNNSSSLFMRVYPNVFSRGTYDRGDNVVDTYVGWNSTVTRMKAGVRFTAAADIKLAGVDFVYRTDTITSGNFSVQVRAAGGTTDAPGAVLYTQEYSANSSYLSQNGNYFTFAFGADAPAIASGSDYWITIKAPAGVTYPGGTQAIASGRSFYEGNVDTTAWTALVLSTVDYSWMMRSINVAQPTLTVKALFEGLNFGHVNGSEGKMIADTVVVELHNATTPFALVESVSAVFDTLGNAVAKFSLPEDGANYYLVLNHRNSVETWSAASQTFTNSALAYDFSTAANKAYGDNLKAVGSFFTIYTGDSNKDDFVDFTDLTLIDNDSYNFVEGYVITDLNGDLFVDFTDLTLCDNNSYNFIGSVTPLTGKKVINTKPVRYFGKDSKKIVNE